MAAKLSAALRGMGKLSGQDDFVDAECRIVEPILTKATPACP